MPFSKENSSPHDFQPRSLMIQVRSEGYSAERFNVAQGISAAWKDSFIRIDGIDVVREKGFSYGRGLNIAVIDPQSGSLTDFAVFDTCNIENEEDEKNQQVRNQLVNFIENIPAGKIIALTVLDEAVLHLYTQFNEQENERINQLFQALGSKVYPKLNPYQQHKEAHTSFAFRSAWSLLAVKGTGVVLQEDFSPRVTNPEDPWDSSEYAQATVNVNWQLQDYLSLQREFENNLETYSFYLLLLCDKTTLVNSFKTILEETTASGLNDHCKEIIKGLTQARAFTDLLNTIFKDHRQLCPHLIELVRLEASMPSELLTCRMAELKPMLLEALGETAKLKIRSYQQACQSKTNQLKRLHRHYLGEFQDELNQQLEIVLEQLLSSYCFIAKEDYQKKIKTLNSTQELIHYLTTLSDSEINQSLLQKCCDLLARENELGKDSFDKLQIIIKHAFEPVQVRRHETERLVLTIQGRHLALSRIKTAIDDYLARYPEYLRKSVYQATPQNEQDRGDYQVWLLPNEKHSKIDTEKKAIYLSQHNNGDIEGNVVHDNKFVDRLNLTALAAEEVEIRTLLAQLKWPTKETKVNLEPKLINFIFELCQGIREIYIDIPGIFYWDCDLRLPGKNFIVNASTTWVEKTATLDLSGRKGKPFEGKNRRARSGEAIRKANNGASVDYDGHSGENGRCGAAGESSGHFVLNADLMANDAQQLKVILNGGDGAEGQQGGHGEQGKNGQDGKDGEVKNEKSFFQLRNRIYISHATLPTAGGQGGNGGSGGLEGEGGCAGTVRLKDKCIKAEKGVISFLSQGGFLIAEGKAGKGNTNNEAENGKGANGGTGGAYALDYVCHHISSWSAKDTGKYFKPEHTIDGKGSYTIEKKRPWWSLGVIQEYIKTPDAKELKEAKKNRKTADSGEQGEEVQLAKNNKRKNLAEKSVLISSHGIAQKCQKLAQKGATVDNSQFDKKREKLLDFEAALQELMDELEKYSELTNCVNSLIDNSKKVIEKETQAQEQLTAEVLQNFNQEKWLPAITRVQGSERKDAYAFELLLNNRVKNNFYNQYKNQLNKDELACLEQFLVKLDYEGLPLLEPDYEVTLKRLLEENKKNELSSKKLLENNHVDSTYEVDEHLEKMRLFKRNLMSGVYSHLNIPYAKDGYRNLIAKSGWKKKGLNKQIEQFSTAGLINAEIAERLKNNINWLFNDYRRQSDKERKLFEADLIQLMKKVRQTPKYLPLFNSFLTSIDCLVDFQNTYSSWAESFYFSEATNYFCKIVDHIQNRLIIKLSGSKKATIKSISILLEAIKDSGLSDAEIFKLFDNSFPQKWFSYLLREQLQRQLLLFLSKATSEPVEALTLSNNVSCHNHRVNYLDDVPQQNLPCDCDNTPNNLEKMLHFITNYPLMMGIILEKLKKENALINELSRISLADFMTIFTESNWPLFTQQETAFYLNQLPIGEWSTYFKKSHWINKLPHLDAHLRHEMFELISDLYNRFDQKMIEQLIDMISAYKEPNYSAVIAVMHYLMRHESLATEEIVLELKKAEPKDWLIILENKKHQFWQQEETLSLDALIENLEFDLSTKENEKFGEILKERISKIKSCIYSSGPQTLIAKPIAQWEQEDIREKWIVYVGESKKTDRNWVQNHLSEVLAIISHAVALTYDGNKPRDTQLLALLLYLEAANHGQGRLGQVATGEGKTITMAMLAIVHVLIGHPVNIITSSSVLAERDTKETEALYHCFCLTVNNNCDKKARDDVEVRKQRYNAPIVYGDVSSFQRDRLLTNFFEQGVLTHRKDEILLVDEVDSMLLDKGDNTLYLSHEIIDFRHLRPLYLEIWNAVNSPDIKNYDEQEFIALVQSKIREKIANKAINFPQYLEKFVNYRLPIWIECAMQARQLTEKQQFIDDKNDIVIMDNDTGVEQENMHWSNGLHQFLQLLKLKKLKNESLKAIFQSNLNYFQDHIGKIYGISGTIGSETDQKLFNQLYRMDYFKMPRFKRHRFYEEKGIVVSSEEEWLRAILNEMNEHSERPVLVICENIAVVEKIQMYLEKEKLTTSLYVYDKSTTKLKVGNKKHPLQAGDGILATNLAGRGLNLIVSGAAKAAGGLRVILTYMPLNARIERQALGRTARQGALGSGKCIILNHQCQDIHIIRRQRDHQAILSAEQIRTLTVQSIHMEELLFKEFAKTCIEVKKLLSSAKNDDFHKAYVNRQLKSLNDRWAFWLDEQSELIKRVTVTGEKTLLTAYRNFHDSMVNTANDKGFYKFIESPQELIGLGYCCFVHKQQEQALLCFDKVINQYPLHAEIAYHWKARVLSEQKDTDEKRIEIKKLLKAEQALIEYRITDDLIPMHTALFSAIAFNRSQGNGQACNHFEKQIENEAALYQVHLSAINNIIGRPLNEAMFQEALQNDEQRKQLYEKLIQQSEYANSYRFNRKMVINKEGDEKSLFIPTPIGNKKLELSSLPINMQKQIIDYLEEQLNAYAEAEKSQKCKLQWFISEATLANNFKSMPVSSLEITQSVLKILWKRLVDQGVIKSPKINISNKDPEKTKKINDLKSWLRKEIISLMAVEYLMIDELPSAEDLAKVKAGRMVIFEKKGELYSIHFIDTNKIYCHRPLKIANSEQAKSLPKGGGLSKVKYDMLNTIYSTHETVKNLKSLKDEPLNKSIVIKDEEDIKKLTKIASLNGCGINKMIDEQVETIDAIINQHLGKLKILPAFNFHVQTIQKFFRNGECPGEYFQFATMLFDEILVFDPKINHWNWNALAVALLGISQVALGIALEVGSMGSASVASMVLIAEGIGDVIYAGYEGYTGRFSWSGYAMHKAMSVAMNTVMACTMGVGAIGTAGEVGSLRLASRFAPELILDTIIYAGKRVSFEACKATGIKMVEIALRRLCNYLPHEITLLVGDRIQKEINDSRAVKEKQAILQTSMSRLFLLTDTKHAQQIIDDVMSKTLKNSLNNTFGAQIIDTAFSLASEIPKAILMSLNKANMGMFAIDTLSMIIVGNIEATYKAYRLVTLAPSIYDALTNELNEQIATITTGDKEHCKRAMTKEEDAYIKQVLEETNQAISKQLIMQATNVFLQPGLFSVMQKAIHTVTNHIQRMMQRDLRQNQLKRIRESQEQLKSDRENIYQATLKQQNPLKEEQERWIDGCDRSLKEMENSLKNIAVGGRSKLNHFMDDYLYQQRNRGSRGILKQINRIELSLIGNNYNNISNELKIILLKHSFILTRNCLIAAIKSHYNKEETLLSGKFRAYQREVDRLNQSAQKEEEKLIKSMIALILIEHKIQQEFDKLKILSLDDLRNYQNPEIDIENNLIEEAETLYASCLLKNAPDERSDVVREYLGDISEDNESIESLLESLNKLFLDFNQPKNGDYFMKKNQSALTNVSDKKSCFSLSSDQKKEIMTFGMQQLQQGIYDEKLSNLLGSGAMSETGFVMNSFLNNMMRAHSQVIMANTMLQNKVTDALNYLIETQANFQTRITDISDRQIAFLDTVKESVDKNIEKLVGLVSKEPEILKDPSLSADNKVKIYENYQQTVRKTAPHIKEAITSSYGQLKKMCGENIMQQQFLENSTKCMEQLVKRMLDTVDKTAELNVGAFDRFAKVCCEGLSGLITARITNSQQDESEQSSSTKKNESLPAPAANKAKCGARPRKRVERFFIAEDDFIPTEEDKASIQADERFKQNRNNTNKDALRPLALKSNERYKIKLFDKAVLVEDDWVKARKEDTNEKGVVPTNFMKAVS